MVDKETSFEKLFFLSKLFMAFPLRNDKSGFYRCPRLTALCLVNIFLTIYAIVNLSSSLDLIPVAGPLFCTAQWMKVLHTIVFILCPLLDVNSLNDIQKTLASIDDSLCDYVTTLESPKIWQYASIYICLNLFIFVTGLSIWQDDIFFLILMFWVILTNHILECQILGLIDFFEMRFTLLLQLVQPLSRRKCPPLMMTLKLSRIHRSMSECLLKSNELFSLQLMVLTSTCFVFVAVESYCLILLSCDKFEFRTIMDYIVQIFLVISSFSNFYLIASKAQTITIKARTFTTVLYQLMQRETSSVLANHKTLCLHIARKNEVVLTVCGFFNLDLTLVYSMMGAVTTYLAIILQFAERAALLTVSR